MGEICDAYMLECRVHTEQYEYQRGCLCTKFCPFQTPNPYVESLTPNVSALEMGL